MATLPELPEIDAIFVFYGKVSFWFKILILSLILSLESPFVNIYLSSFLINVIFFVKKWGCRGSIKKCITPELLEIDNWFFFFIKFLKVWPIFCAVSNEKIPKSTISQSIGSFVQNIKSPKVLHRLLWNFDTTLHSNTRVFWFT
jgi:hypothetical protein